MPIKTDGQQPSFWNKNPLAQGEVTALWLAGHTATAIIKMLGLDISRSALLGKMNRMGLVGHVRGSKAPPKDKTKEAKKPALRQQRKTYRTRKPVNDETDKDAPPIMAGFMTDIPTEDIVTAVSLYDSKPHHCRWPVGHLLFCGARAIPGARLSYCPVHYDRSTSATRGPYVKPRIFVSKYR